MPTFRGDFLDMTDDIQQEAFCPECIFFRQGNLAQPNLPGNSPAIRQIQLEWRRKMEEIALGEQDAINQGEQYFSQEPRTINWCEHFSYNALNPVTGENVFQYAICQQFNSPPEKRCSEFKLH